MLTTKLSSKGQIVLPWAIRKSRRWGAGTRFVVAETADGVVLRTCKPHPVTKLSEVIGCTGYQGPPKTLEEMDAAILKEARRRGGP